MLTSGIILTIGRHATLRLLGVYFRPSQIVYVTLNTMRAVVPKWRDWSTTTKIPYNKEFHRIQIFFRGCRVCSRGMANFLWQIWQRKRG